MVVIGDTATPESKEIVSFVVIHNKKKFDIDFPLDSTVSKLKLYLQNIISMFQSPFFIHSKHVKTI